MKSILAILMFGAINTMGDHHKKYYTTTTTDKPATTWSTQPHTTKPVDNKCYDLPITNPCTEENILAKNFYFKSCSSCCSFIQCDEFGDAFERPCAPGTSWDQKLQTCNHINNGQCKDKCTKYTPEPTKKKHYYTSTTPEPTKKKSYTTAKPTKQPTPSKKYTTAQPTKKQSYTTTKKYTPKKCYNTKDKNPCNHAQRESGLYYFKSCSGCKNFIQCDDFGKAFDMCCGEGTHWDQDLLTCAHDYENQCKDDCVLPTPSPVEVDEDCYNTFEKNPCTEENVEAGKFYFKSCKSCCNFIQCDEYYNAFDMPCGVGTYWDQKALTCNYNYGQCEDECGVGNAYETTQKPM